jgi:hypothetical protein
MASVLDPFRFVVIALCGWINHHQLLIIIDYLREENRVLREQLGDRHPRFNGDQRRRLAAKAKGLGRKILADLATIVTPETLLAWHCKLIATDTTAQPTSDQVGHAPMERSRSWWFEWRTRIGIGAIGASRVRYPIWDMTLRGARSRKFSNTTGLNRHQRGVGR